MLKRRRFIIGGLIILAALSYIIYGGMQQAIVYFVTPSELKAKESASADKFLRMGGMVVTGSLQKDLKNLTYRFDLTDGNAAFPVFFRGVPPDLFTEGKGRSGGGSNWPRWCLSSDNHYGQARGRIQSPPRW